jgi:Nucleotidyltransferase
MDDIHLSDNAARQVIDSSTIFDEFIRVRGKREREARLTSLRDAERLDKALKAGRVPNTVAAVLQSIEAAGLKPHFTVVGTHALYDYEAAAGVRTVSPHTFVAFKQWMAKEAVHREEAKRRRDLRQAGMVQSLLDNGLLATEAGVR